MSDIQQDPVTEKTALLAGLAALCTYAGKLGGPEALTLIEQCGAIRDQLDDVPDAAMAARRRIRELEQQLGRTNRELFSARAENVELRTAMIGLALCVEKPWWRRRSWVRRWYGRHVHDGSSGTPYASR